MAVGGFVDPSVRAVVVVVEAARRVVEQREVVLRLLLVAVVVVGGAVVVVVVELWLFTLGAWYSKSSGNGGRTMVGCCGLFC